MFKHMENWSLVNGWKQRSKSIFMGRPSSFYCTIKVVKQRLGRSVHTAGIRARRRAWALLAGGVPQRFQMCQGCSGGDMKWQSAQGWLSVFFLALPPSPASSSSSQAPSFSLLGPSSPKVSTTNFVCLHLHEGEAEALRPLWAPTSAVAAGDGTHASVLKNTWMLSPFPNNNISIKITDFPSCSVALFLCLGGRAADRNLRPSSPDPSSPAARAAGESLERWKMEFPRARQQRATGEQPLHGISLVNSPCEYQTSQKRAAFTALLTAKTSPQVTATSHFCHGSASFYTALGLPQPCLLTQ